MLNKPHHNWQIKKTDIFVLETASLAAPQNTEQKSLNKEYKGFTQTLYMSEGYHQSYNSCYFQTYKNMMCANILYY